MKPQQERLRREGTRFLKFMIVGAIGAVIDFGTFNLLNLAFNVWSVTASTISFIAAVCSNFLWNRFWTYPDSRSKPLLRQATQFLVINLIGWIIRTPIFVISEKPWTAVSASTILPFLNQFPFLQTIAASLDSVSMGRNLALATAVLVVMLWNFFINRIWTYSDIQ